MSGTVKSTCRGEPVEDRVRRALRRQVRATAAEIARMARSDAKTVRKVCDAASWATHEGTTAMGSAIYQWRAA